MGSPMLPATDIPMTTRIPTTPCIRTTTRIPTTPCIRTTQRMARVTTLPLYTTRATRRARIGTLWPPGGTTRPRDPYKCLAT
ncbi:MAG: hypothetical protein ACHQZQ_02650 [SAR324 cluster bacterium]